MQKTIRLLVILLLLQGLLVLLIHWPQNEPASGGMTSLLAFNENAVDEILLQGPGHEVIKITRGKHGWELPGYFHLPADDGKVQQLISRLSKINPGWSVATTRESAERFEVGKEHYQRKVVLLQAGKPVASLLVGTSTGLRKVYARIPGDNRIYAIDLTTYELALKQVAWMDKMLLAIKHKPGFLQGKDFVIRRKNDIWLLDKVKGNEILDQQKVTRLLNQLQDLTVIEVVDKKSIGNEQQDGLVLKVGQAEQVREYTFTRSGDQYLVHSSRYPVHFRMFAATGKALMQVSRETITSQPGTAPGMGQK